MTQSAVLPSTPIFPELRTSLIVGGVLGFGVGIAFALMRTVSDRRIRSADDVESRTGLPVVGTIPLTNAGDSRLFDRPRCPRRALEFAVAEALRSLRTNLQFMDVDNPPRTIVVTSPLPSDGKSTIACNLAADPRRQRQACRAHRRRPPSVDGGQDHGPPRRSGAQRRAGGPCRDRRRAAADADTTTSSS